MMTGSDTKLAATAQGRSRFSPEIEGLRAIAIVLVLLFHAGIDQIPGGFVGVDVFFVISGFLITGLLVREAERTGRVDLARFWARRAKRLLPASALTLAVTALASWFLLPATSWRDVGGDIAASALYAVNWRFAAEAVDYTAEGAGTSPVLHFWSLAVEEQFYVLWPLIVLAVLALARRSSRFPLRPMLTIAIGVLAVASFVGSLALGTASSDAAFFMTTTRLWELGVGAVVAILAPRWAGIPHGLTVLAGWLGLSALAVATLKFSASAPWPGAGTLLPTLGTAAVIIAATSPNGARTLISRLLRLRPMVWVGGLSYSLYLLHWPFLVLATAHFGELGRKRSLVVVALSGLIAWLCHRLVENPIRYSVAVSRSNPLALSLGANLTLVGATIGALLVIAVPAPSGSPTSAEGARALERPSPDASGVDLADVDSVEFIVPAPVEAAQDYPDVRLEGCVTDLDSSAVLVCEYGDLHSEVTVAVVGDSKIEQWAPALRSIADAEGWHLVTLLKSACAFVEPQFEESDTRRARCAEWSRAALEHVLAIDPQVVVTSNFRINDGTVRGDPTAGAEMTVAWWQRLAEDGITVIPILDNPLPPTQIFECVEQYRDELSRCAFEKNAGASGSGAVYQRIAAEKLGIENIVDMDDVICPDGKRCPAVIGNVLVYRHGSHLTRTYVETATGALAKRLVPLVDDASMQDQG